MRQLRSAVADPYGHVILLGLLTWFTLEAAAELVERVLSPLADALGL